MSEDTIAAENQSAVLKRPYLSPKMLPGVARNEGDDNFLPLVDENQQR